MFIGLPFSFASFASLASFAVNILLYERSLTALTMTLFSFDTPPTHRK
jgi:hypothetical protein